MMRPFALRARPFAVASILASFACACLAQTAGAPAAEAPSIALLLPSQQTVLAQAAEAVRLGFFAARDAQGKGPNIQVLEVDDDVGQLYAAIDGAKSRGVRLVVGPLPRSAVNAVIDGAQATLPLLALNYPERDAGAPLTTIALGLSAEAEANYVVRIALDEFVGARRVPGTGPRFAVLSGPGTLERRVAQAYVGALRAAGEPPIVVDVTEPVTEWVRQLERARVEAVFLALDAREAALLRARISREVLLFGTSLLNIGATQASPELLSLAHDLDGVRFVDMPWLVTSAPRSGTDLVPTQPLPVELARLFALGVDAYRVAEHWSRGETRFSVDGMTGRLSVDRALSPRVERKPASAIYRNGAIEREELGR